MKTISITPIFLILLASCQSKSHHSKLSNAEAQERSMRQMENIIYCSWKAATPGDSSFDVEAHIQDSEAQSIRLVINTQQPGEAITSVTKQSSRSIDFEVPNQGMFKIQLSATPTLTSVRSNPNGASSVSCVRLLTATDQSTIKSATCNAVGTPAAGWYQAGRILKLREKCHNETLTCGINSTPGWFVQKKTQITSIKKEKCGWRRQTPKCQTKDGFAGWYLDEELVAADPSCQDKSIECNEYGTSKEGWFTYLKSTPELLVESNCISNREISYLER